ncbi:TonB-dependent siderophore receptor [Pacificimonas sp. WHA3]|uniref:TonB-dependent siderophore receptor n=1 Tax=Pacificimonas pallii TaxID=2827236 RepID=A0ABS6SA70_9SPHN|nr:TonB-dependent siderophore receptor [Pacificimonas pallii]MBV7255269.1 TonB-dependent siderophore receptor [Pacificimonas pallii]
MLKHMLKKRDYVRSALLLATGTLSIPVYAQSANAVDGADENLDEDTILVIGLRNDRVSEGATGLPLTIKDTPQSVTIIERDFLDDFGLDNINDVLTLATGVNVERVETDRTYFNARGFDIKSMQVDGIGLPFLYEVTGQVDTALFERIEIVKGANGLLTGTGTPSGTINFIRKRPTNDFQMQVSATAGSWDHFRGDVDISGPVSGDGTWSARFVGALETKDSYLDNYSNDRKVLYGIVDGGIGDNGVLTLGITHQDSRSGGVMWGALPTVFSDGTQTDYPVSSSTAQDWTYWNTKRTTAFAEIDFALSDRWTLRSIATLDYGREDSALFYTYGAPDPQTGLGLFGFPAGYSYDVDRKLFDANLVGDISIGGREHDLVLGVNYADADNIYSESPIDFSDPGFGPQPAFPGWTGQESPEPTFMDPIVQGDWNDKHFRAFAVGNFSLSDALNVIAGLNFVSVDSSGSFFGGSRDVKEDKVSPYVGVTYAVTPEINLYASYSDIFQPQPELGAGLVPLGSAKGKSYEAGIKAGLFNDKLLLTAAVFRAEQQNYAEYLTADAGTGVRIYEGNDIDSKGFEFEIVGNITDRWYVRGGYTHVDLKEPGVGDTRTFIPTDTANVSTTFEPIDNLKFGGSLRWQSRATYDNGFTRYSQDPYAVASVFGSYMFSQRLNLTVNVNNIFDTKYYQSLYWDQAFYAAPRQASASLTFTY